MSLAVWRSLARLLSPAVLAAVAGAQGEAYVLPGGDPASSMGRTVAGIGDLDKDGVPDIAAAGTPGTAGTLSSIRVWSGKTGALLLDLHSGTLANPPTAVYTGIGPAGDVNGDGVLDFWAASYNQVSATFKPWAGAVWIHSGVDGAVLYFFEGTKALELVGRGVAGGADLNGDGFDDFAIGALRQREGPQGTIFLGGVDVHSGRNGGLLYQIGPDSLGSGGGIPALLNDIDGDGVPDFVTSGNATVPSGSSTMLRWFSGADGSTLLVYYAPAGEPVGWAVASAGDVDGDGLHDVVVGSPGETRGIGCLGTVRIHSSADASLLMKFQSPSGPPCEEVGVSVDGVGDFDGDGVPDVAAGTDFPVSIAYVLSGKTGAILFEHTDVWDTWYGYSVAGAGDLNGDGLGDLLVGQANNDFQFTGSVHVYLAGCPSPASYCTAKTSSLGCKAKLSWEGLLSLSIADNFAVRATDVVSSQIGLLAWSRERAVVPFFGGTLCLSGPIARLAPQSTGGSPPSVDCSGVIAYALTQALATDQGWTAGDRICAQIWYRDPTHPDQTRYGQ